MGKILTGILLLELTVAGCAEKNFKNVDFADPSLNGLYEDSDIVIFGEVVEVHDYTAKDGGMGYDINIEKYFKGDVEEIKKRTDKLKGNTVLIHCGGWINYLVYKKGDKVLLFLRFYCSHTPKEEQLIPKYTELTPVLKHPHGFEKRELYLDALKNRLLKEPQIR